MHQLVPPMILDRLEAGESAGSFPAACLFVDTAGFTPLTTALMAHGAEGVEVIAAILRTVFRPLVYAVYEQGGFIAGFAGDSFKAVFPGAGDEVYARCALAAEAIRRHMAAHPRVETRFGSFDFAVKGCVADGAVEWEIWRGEGRGDGRQSAAYTFAGPALDRCMAMDPAVGGGEVALSAAVAARLDRTLVRLEAAGPYWRLRGIDPALAAAHPSLAVAVPHDDERAAAFMPPAILHTAIQGEFRQVVSMFVNLGELPPEPEERAELYRRMFAILARHGGYLCRVGRIGAGDAGATWLLFWGAPTSVEQDLQRALNFAVDLREAIAVPLRAGITNRLAYAGFVGADLREEYTCYGTAVNLAARLMGSAGWGEIWLDQECARGADAEFICQPLGERLFKGFAAEQPVFALKGRQQRWHPVAYGRPLIGRAAETARLDATLAALAKGANGGMTVVCGEAGIGKSHLLYEVQRHFAVQWFYCPSDGVVHQSLYPWRYFLRRYFAQDSAQSDEENRLLFDFGIEALIEATPDPALGRELRRTRSLLAALVDIYWPGSLYERLEPKGRFENTLDAIKTLVRAESLRQPLALHLEDAHWLDPDTLQFIPSLLRSVAGYPVAVIATMRPTDGHPLLDGAQVLQLDPLDDAAIRQLAATLLGHPPPDHVSALVLARAEGNPFFAEQILLYMQEQGMLEAGADAALLPTNVWAILIARLDLLANAIKQVVQTAAVLGREFEVGLLAAMLHDEELMRQSLDSGQEMAIWSAINQLRYIFRHALLRDAAYTMQLYARRRTLHELAARTLESLYAADLRPHYAALAYHYEQAADPAGTRRYLKKAADQAKEGYQNASALGYYDRLIALLQTPPDAESTLPDQVDALCQRGSIELLTGDWPAAEATFAAALEIAAGLADPQPLARTQGLFSDFWQQKGDYAQALALVRSALELDERHADARTLAETLGRLGTVHWRLGEYDQALSVHQRALALAESAGDLAGVARQQRNIGLVYDGTGEVPLGLAAFEQALALERQLDNTLGVAVCLGNIGALYNKLGEHAQALEHHQQALALVEAIGDKPRIATSLGNIGMAYWYLGRYDQVLAHYQQALQMDQELDNRAGVARHVGNIGTLHAQLGDFPQAVAYFEQALAMTREFGFTASVAGWLNNLGIMAREMGALPRALEYFDEAIPLHRSIGKKFRLAEALIEKAEALTLLGRDAEAADLAAEGLALGREIQSQHWIEQGETLLARLRYRSGDPAAPAEFAALIAAASSPRQRANLHYWLWKLGAGPEHAREASQLYAELQRDDADILFKQRLGELGGEDSGFRVQDSG